MKIYRVVPDSFATGKRLNANENVNSEGIYYKIGYISFSNKIARHDYNNLQCEGKQGKYFYLFAEDAIREGNSLINVYHRLRANTVSVIEYDVPEDIIMKNIGYGDYTRDIMPRFLAETFIEKCDFGSHIITSDQVEKEKILRYLILVFKDSLKRMHEYGFAAYEDSEFYKDYFDVNSLSSIDDDEKIKHALENSAFYHAFLNQQRELILSTYITGKTLPVNMKFISYELSNFDKYGEYYQTLGVRCDFSKEHREFKKELLYNIGKTNPDKEKIKRLLKEKKYI